LRNAAGWLYYERIAWWRGDFAHQHSRHVVNHGDAIALADLSVNRMTHDQCLAKGMQDASWRQFAVTSPTRQRGPVGSLSL